jgi:hypothetical protein
VTDLCLDVGAEEARLSLHQLVPSTI